MMKKSKITILDSICAHCALPMRQHEPMVNSFEFGSCEKFIPGLRGQPAPEGAPAQWNSPTLNS
jgi:hypothetical protein